MKILVINTGSSSVKYQLFEMENRSVVSSGLIERIGENTSKHIHKSKNISSPHIVEKIISNHEAGIAEMDKFLTHKEMGVIRSSSEISAIGHRVVHGGEIFQNPVIIDSKVIQAIEENIPLAPLHNPGNLSGIFAAKKYFASVPNVAVFDTAFHQTMPEKVFRYAIPDEYYTKHKIRRYGFHGISHEYVTKKSAEFLNKDLNDVNLITLHLGNGASATAIQNGKSLNTSMGMTPLEGLIMGTRCGDIDPAIHFYLMNSVKMNSKEIDNLFNKESGLKGLGLSNDMRDVLQKEKENDRNAKLILEMYVHRIRKYIGAYLVELEGKVDAIVFTAGIGENSPYIRERCTKGLKSLGIEISDSFNTSDNRGIREINKSNSRIKILVIPTNEELEIAIQSEGLLKSKKKK